MGQDSISRTAIKIMMPKYSNFSKTLLCQRRSWRDFSILAIQSSYNPAPAVCQLNLPHHHHQSPLVLKILVTQEMARRIEWLLKTFAYFIDVTVEVLEQLCR